MRLLLGERLRVLLVRLRETLRRPTLMTELDDELRTHLELETAYNIERGMSPADAERSARIALGGIERAREAVDDARGYRLLDNAVRDLRFAARQLRRTPAFTASVALTLAMGIGATTAVFAVLESVILMPLPYREADRLVGVWWSLPAMGFDRAPQSVGTYFAIRRLSTSFDGVSVFDRAAVNVTSPGDDAHPERITAAKATASLFPLLGTSFAVGRAFSESEDLPGAPPVVVISDPLWRRRYGANPGVIGKPIVIDGQTHTIIGVASAGFHFPDDATELWTPIGLDSNVAYGGAFGHQAFARLKPGLSAHDAERELTRLIPRAAALYPNIAPDMPTAPFLEQARAGIAVRPMRDDVVGNFGGVVWIAVGAGFLLFATALGNAAGLLLTRAERRQRELALRVVLGASTKRVLAQFFSESLLVGVLGGTLGLAFAMLGVRLLVRAAPSAIPRVSEISVRPAAIAFAVVMTTAMSFACSAVAALRLDMRNLATRLREGPRGGTAGRDRQKTRRALVVCQVAFATLLVSGAVLLLQNVDRLRRVDPGFDAAHALTAWLSLPVTSYPNDRDVVRFTSQLATRVGQLPGVSAAGVSSKVPLYGLGQTYTPVWTDADAGTSTTLPPSELVVVASGGFFRALGIPLLAGRTFESSDRQNAYEVIVDRSLARSYWADSTGRHAIGRRIRLTKDPKSPSWYTVVGVVGSVADTSLSGPPIGVVYLPQVVSPDSQRSAVTRLIALSVRSTGDPRAIRAFVERAIAETDRSVPPFNVKLMADVLRDSTARLWFILVILGTTAAVALVLAAVGLYGILSLIVNARSKEMSIRIAMGALPSTVAALVTRQGAALAGTGAVLGVALFLFVARYFESAVSGLTGPGVLTVAAAPVVLMCVTVVASSIPARRAARADPARALASD